MQSTLREHKDNVGGTYSKYNMLKVSIDTGLTFVRMYLTHNTSFYKRMWHLMRGKVYFNAYFTIHMPD